MSRQSNDRNMNKLPWSILKGWDIPPRRQTDREMLLEGMSKKGRELYERRRQRLESGMRDDSDSDTPQPMDKMREWSPPREYWE